MQAMRLTFGDDTCEQYRNPDELSKFIRSKIVNKEMYYILSIHSTGLPNPLPGSDINVNMYLMSSGFFHAPAVPPPQGAGLQALKSANLRECLFLKGIYRTGY